MPKIIVCILSLLCFQISFGQLSKEQLQQGYDYYNSKEIVISPDTNLSARTLNPNQIEFVCKWMNMDSISRNFESQRIIVNNRFEHLKIDLDSVFGIEEIRSLNQKLQYLESVQLDKEKLRPIYQLRDSAYFKQAFPIIQKGKDGGLYAFIYEEAIFFSKAYGRMRIEKKLEDDWKWFGSVRIPRFDISEFKRKIKNMPEAYQAINSFLISGEGKIQSEFAPVNGGGKIYDRYAEFKTWAQIQKSSLDEDINVRDHFSQSDLESISKYLNSDPYGSINENYLLGDLISINKSEIKNLDNPYGIYRLSMPFIFQANIDGCKYAVFYWSKTDGPLNGSGNILVMKKVNGKYVKFISHMLWIS